MDDPIIALIDLVLSRSGPHEVISLDLGRGWVIEHNALAHPVTGKGGSLEGGEVRIWHHGLAVGRVRAGNVDVACDTDALRFALVNKATEQAYGVTERVADRARRRSLPRLTNGHGQPMPWPKGARA